MPQANAEISSRKSSSGHVPKSQKYYNGRFVVLSKNELSWNKTTTLWFALKTALRKDTIVVAKTL